VLAGGSSDLQTDPARADHYESGLIGEGFGDPVGLRHRAQIQHAVQVGTGNIQAAGRRAVGQQQLVVIRVSLGLVLNPAVRTPR
jgi:hypothetical protein